MIKVRSKKIWICIYYDWPQTEKTQINKKEWCWINHKINVKHKSQNQAKRATNDIKHTFQWLVTFACSVCKKGKRKSVMNEAFPWCSKCIQCHHIYGQSCLWAPWENTCKFVCFNHKSVIFADSVCLAAEVSRVCPDMT